MPTYLYQNPEWPRLHWRDEELIALLADVRNRQGKLLGRMTNLGFDLQQEASLVALTEEVIKSSEIEGEILDSDQVRSSLARRLGLDRTRPDTLRSRRGRRSGNDGRCRAKNAVRHVNLEKTSSSDSNQGKEGPPLTAARRPPSAIARLPGRLPPHPLAIRGANQGAILGHFHSVGFRKCQGTLRPTRSTDRRRPAPQLRVASGGARYAATGRKGPAGSREHPDNQNLPPHLQRTLS